MHPADHICEHRSALIIQYYDLSIKYPILYIKELGIQQLRKLLSQVSAAATLDMNFVFVEIDEHSDTILSLIHI